MYDGKLWGSADSDDKAKDGDQGSKSRHVGGRSKP
jgi:hypothetical protein